MNGLNKHHTPHILKFKTVRVAKEWETGDIPQKLRDIVILGAYYSSSFFKKPMTITGIFRTDPEQDDTYKDNEAYQKKPWKSVHQYWRGIDIKSRDYTKKEIQKLLTVFNTIQYRDGKKKTAIYHTVGKGKHLHLQV